MNKEKKNSSRFFIISIAVSALLIVMCIPTYAFLSDQKEKSEQITVGTCKVEVVEEFDPPEKITEGLEIKKKPSIKNTGTIPCYVRIRADVSNGQLEKYLEFDFNTDDWSTKQEDGYFYYNEILDPGKETKPLFTTVLTADSIPEEVISNFDIYVYGEGIQTNGYADAQTAWNRYESK